MKRITILVVEDEVIIAQCLKMELELTGYEVCDFVTSGAESEAPPYPVNATASIGDG